MDTLVTHSEGQDTSSQEESLKKGSRPFIDYELLVWAVYGTITILSIVDRFTWNLWPRQTHRIGAGTAGSDFLDGLKKGPWSVKVYDIIARVSGRFSIMSLNLLFFTMMHSTTSALSESWFARHLVDFSNVIEANRRLHKWNGIVLVVMTVVHVWSILFPSIFHGWDVEISVGSFEWILSERKPAGFKDVNAFTETVGLQVDDVFRIVEMTILLCILMPLSVRWLTTRWHIGIHLHRFISVIYFIDIVRRHTHPHSWILNTPFFVASIADLAVGVYWRRLKPEVYRLRLSDDYILLFWNQMRTIETAGPKFFLRLCKSSFFERAHVFTGFENRRNLDLADGRSWTSCLLVRVYHNKRRPRLGRKDKISHTHRVAEATNLDVYTWGPFLGSMSEQVRRSLEDSRPVTLIAGGSAAGYLIDAIQMHKGYRGASLTMLYTSRDAALFQWVVQVFGALMKDHSLGNINVVVAVTDGGNKSDNELADLVAGKQRELESDSSSSFDGKSKGTLRVQYGRIDFAKEVPKENIVYFQGSGGLQNAVEKACKTKKCKVIAGQAFDQDPNRKVNFLSALRMNCLNRNDEIV